MSSTCTVDTQAITKYYNNKAGMSFIPFIGDSIGDAAFKKPPDHSQDLTNKQNELTSSITDCIKELGQDVSQLYTNLNSLQGILPNYIQTTAQLTSEPVSEKVTLLSIQLVSLVIIVLAIIFIGL
jgi:hypothetical protein